MKQGLATVAVVLTLASAFWLAAGESAEDIKNYDSDGKTVVVLGDSLVQGVGATQGNDFVTLLSNKTGVPIVNMGVSGDTSERALARVGEVIKEDPKIVILLIGGNDYLQKKPITETFANISRIIEEVQASGAAVILLGVRGGLFSDKFDEEFEKLAEEYETAYVSDVLDGLFGNSELMSDAIHPNDKGYAIIAERVLPKLELLLNN